MISCITFKKKLNDYIQGSISDDFKASMEDHILNCKSCHAVYEEELQIHNAFKDVVNIRAIKFNSTRDEIVKCIDKNRYSKRISNKIYYKFRKNIMTFAASILLLFTMTSGSLYFYSLYVNRAGKTASIKEGYSLSEKTDNNIPNETIKPKTANKIRSLIETSLPLPGTSNNKETQDVLDKLEKETLGVAPWTIGYTDNRKVIFYNHSALLAYSYSNGKSKYYAGIDLGKIDAGHIQGSVHTEFNFSLNGDYVVINNGTGENNLQSNKYPMYLYDFNKGKMNIISYENKFNLKDAWSSTSNYYVFGDKTGERIFVYDITSDTSTTISFNKGNISTIFVSDFGDIIIESLSDTKTNTPVVKYMLKKDNSYQPEEYFIPGIIIGMKENSVLFYDQDTVYELISGKSSAIKNLGSGFNIQKLQKEYALFTDGLCTYVYDYNRNFYKYTTLFTQNDFIEFSPNMTKAALISNNSAKIIYADNIKDIVEIGFPNDFSSSYKWYGNNNLIRISQVDNSDVLGDFTLYKANIAAENAIEYNSETDEESREQYGAGFFIDSTNISSLEMANIIISNYFDQLKDENARTSLRITDYKINAIRVDKHIGDNLQFSIQYSVLPYDNTTLEYGTTKDRDGWHNNIFSSVSVISEDKIYHIIHISKKTE